MNQSLRNPRQGERWVHESDEVASLNQEESDDGAGLRLPGKNLVDRTVLQTDTGEQVEYTKALGRTMLKELGKMAP